jgi:hypothetical protein
MPTIQLKAGFYQPFVLSQPPKTFLEVLQSINALPDDETRTFAKKNFHPVRIQNLQQWNGFWWGQAMRIRMNEEMQRAKLNGEVKEIEFADDEGLGESSSFLYHPGTNIFILQEVHGAVSRTAFSVYLKAIGQVSRIELRPAINPDALTRIERLNVREFRIRMARIHNAIEAGNGRLTTGLFRSLDALDAGGVNMVVKPERNGRLAKIGDFVRELLRAEEHETLSLEGVSVTGTEDEEVKVIDLLTDRLVTTEEIDVGTGRRPNATQRRDALWNAWNRNEELLRRIYTPQ